MSLPVIPLPAGASTTLGDAHVSSDIHDLERLTERSRRIVHFRLNGEMIETDLPSVWLLAHNEWSSALWWGSSIEGVSRFAAFATTAPRLNANLQIPDPEPTYAYTGDVDSWVYDPDPKVNALNAGQFGFRSQHPTGANFLLGDGSVRFLKETIDPAIYRKLSTKSGAEVLSSDSY